MQNIEPIKWLLYWNDFIPTKVTVEILVNNFYNKWLNALNKWLNNLPVWKEIYVWQEQFNYQHKLTLININYFLGIKVGNQFFQII